jgi:uncharacterized membrane protein
MRSDDDFDLTMEWLTTIAVLIVAFLLCGHGFWALSLCFTLMGLGFSSRCLEKPTSHQPR